MANENEVTFQGPGPFHLPVVQSATAHGDRNNGVTITLNAILPERGPEPESVQAQMTACVARSLSVALQQAAEIADPKG